MAKTDFKTVDEYIGTFPEEVQADLEKIRQAVKKAVPEAEEVISYQIPAFKYHGWILYFSAYKSHYSISMPPPFTAFEVFKKELEGYVLSKSTVQFPKNKPLPLELIKDIAKFRAKENLEKGTKKK